VNSRAKLVNIITSYIEEFSGALNGLRVDEISEAAKIIKGIGQKNLVFIAGNGGSATTATHMATDIGVGSLRKGMPIKAISLMDNVGVLTATANDLSYDDVISEQLRLLAKTGDLLILISASGSSANLLKACEEAKRLGVKTLSLTGFDGGKLKELSDLNIHIQTKIGSYGIVEDLHSMVSHMITECIRTPEGDA
jgi:D-sedoheptulose 7-phosphate isomerase